MIYGIGTDIVEAKRMVPFLDHVARLHRAPFTSRELEDIKGRGAMRHVAAASTWAIKEAVSKCLKSGFTEEIGWKDIEVVRDGIIPRVELSEDAERYLRDRIGDEATYTFHVSVSHDGDLSIAFVILDVLYKDEVDLK